MSRRRIVRKPLSVREHPRRAFEHRLALRFPWLSGLIRQQIGRLPPASRIRQAMLWRATQVGLEAYNRRDFEAVLIAYHPQLEAYPPRELVEIGVLESNYRGHEGFMRMVNEWLTAWGEFRVEPHELIDLGDLGLVLGEVSGRGEGSGIPLTQTFAMLWAQTDGRVTREQHYFDQAEALQAVGLRE